MNHITFRFPRSARHADLYSSHLPNDPPYSKLCLSFVAGIHGSFGPLNLQRVYVHLRARLRRPVVADRLASHPAQLELLLYESRGEEGFFSRTLLLSQSELPSESNLSHFRRYVPHLDSANCAHSGPLVIPKFIYA
jgi:hypothetical protein